MRGRDLDAKILGISAPWHDSDVVLDAVGGYPNRERFRNAILLHLGGRGLAPRSVSARAMFLRRRKSAVRKVQHGI